MKDVLVDIGVIVEYLKTGKGMLPSIYEKFKMKITASTYAELLASSTFKDANLQSEVVDFVNKYFEILDLDKPTALEVAKVIRDYETNLAVSIVAATAKTRKLELVTEDKKTYGKIDGITFLEV